MAVKDGKVSKLRPKIPNAAAPALATPSVQKAAPSIQKAAPGWENTGSEGRKSIKIAPKNSLM